MWLGRRRNVEPNKPESVSQAVEVISWNHNIGDAPESLTPPVDFFTTGWNSAIARSPRVDSDDVNLFASQPQVVSLSVRHPKVQVRGFRFPESAQWSSFMLADSEKPVSPVSGSRTQRRKKTRRRDGDLPQATRMQPPKDIVKLEDRLYYLLQPPLESIIASASLRFPFEPFPYQYEGVAFLFPRFEAVLADEMGLGKTMQAITTIRMLLVSGQLRRILLVCPKPLVSNWLREFATWAPEIPIAAIEGDQKRREWQWRQHEPAVRVANYELVVRDHMFVSEEGNHFDLVVLDEAQRIKNKSNTTSQVIRGISRSRSWALTGTPVENSPDDLVGLFEFLSPGYLHTGMPVPRMAELVGDFVLRRTKDMVMTELPPKMYRDAEISLSPEQWATYQGAEDNGVIKLENMGAELTIQHVFELVLRLKQICNFDPATGASSKLDRLEADLEEVAASGKKAIVFSQWVKTLEKIAQRLERFNPLEYHGKVPSKQRDPILERFKEDPDCSVILMSYGAGSVGLNLQFCEYVFLFDRWWNPAVEDQAINRAHRIGAKGAVTVTRMLSVGTIEERIHQVLEDKRELFNSIFSQTDSPKKLGLSQDEIFGLFDLKLPGRNAA